MAWDTRLKAAWHGETSNADLAAMFAATAGLAGLKQSLEDRRLEAEIEQTGHEWRAVLAVGRIAAPLWLADALVGLAGAFSDAETRAHPDRPSSVGRTTFEVVAALLAPVEDIIADVTIALADPNHRTALVAPLHIGPGGDIAGDDPPDTVPGPYAQGLAAGARQLHTSAAAVLAEVRAQIARSESPDWLKAGLQRLDGELQGAGARLDMSEARLTALAATHTGNSAALTAICRDLWGVLDVAAVAGQMIADPHLLPEAAARTLQHTEATAARTYPAPAPAPSPPTPRRAPEEFVDPLPLPRIDPGAAPLIQRRENAPHPEMSAHTAPPLSVTLPIISEPEPSQPTQPAQTILPQTPQPVAQEKGQAHEAREQEQPAAPRDSTKDSTDTDEETPIRFPEIG